MKHVYWDSCCFIEFLKGSEAGQCLRGVAEMMEAGDLEIVTSAITITEVIKLCGEEASDRKKITQAFEPREGLLVVDLTGHLAEIARDIIWKYSYDKHKIDSIHLATAKYMSNYVEIAELHTFDTDLLQLDDFFDFQIISPTAQLYPQKTESMFDENGEARRDITG